MTWTTNEEAWYWRGAERVHVIVLDVSADGRWARVRRFGGGLITVKTIEADRLKKMDTLPEIR